MQANLLDTAIKYAPENMPILLSTEVKEHELIISVSDCGPGIPPAERERIFERFPQVQGRVMSGVDLVWV